MPAKLRAAKSLRPAFDPGTLDLFRRLEHMRPRRGEAFKQGERELARRLGLVSEWWTGNSVLDRGPPCHPEGYIANSDHARCREVRLALLEALAETLDPS